jgi:ABC-2 type transport system ATP-binding protein
MDPLARQAMWELVYDLADAGIGILVTTHYMDEALFCDRLAMMDAGRIVAQGSPQALLAHPLASPVLELVAADGAACARLLQDAPEVLETIPHAGKLRIRLRRGADVPAVAAACRNTLERGGATVHSLRPAQPELEDVFVALLESAQTGAGA